MSEKSETKGSVRIWTGKLVLNGERKKPGEEVGARIIVTGSAVVFEVFVEPPDETGERSVPVPREWREADPNEIHAASWLRALGATGAEVA